MLNDEGGGLGHKAHQECSEPCSNSGPNHTLRDVFPSQSGGPQKGGGPGAISQVRHMGGAVDFPTISIVISHPEGISKPDMSTSKTGASEGYEGISAVAAAASSKKVFLPTESDKDQCRVCQQQTEEPFIDLGCRCRGELAKVHRSCIEIWFRTKGSNKCEICQQVASNVPFPELQPSTNYWVWRVNSAHGHGQQEQERGCWNPLWIAFALLIGGLFLDVLISVSLGISSLPVNIITGTILLNINIRLQCDQCHIKHYELPFGRIPNGYTTVNVYDYICENTMMPCVLIVLGLAAALRLSMECCQEIGAARHIPPDVTMNPGYHPTA
ncbi:RINGv [Musa troglodytarum]|uniref:RINGv n=1 Tax=Musa troglodytarum TaxID=320322 RepID=A0A9E7K712_9LILI|nr:RINGv [Musa troglodytarum]URE06863.1 RINGv [Musa troglodytarum]